MQVYKRNFQVASMVKLFTAYYSMLPKHFSLTDYTTLPSLYNNYMKNSVVNSRYTYSSSKTLLRVH